MKSFTRRRFITASSAIPLTGGALIASAQAEKPVKSPINPIERAAKLPTPQIPPLPEIPGPTCLMAGPLLGHVSESEASVWIKTSRPAAWSIQVSASADFQAPQVIEGAATKAESALTASVRVVGLEANTRYFYRVLVDGRPVGPQPDPSFVTAPAAAEGKVLRVAFGSCVGRLPEQSAACFGEMAARRHCDLLLMLGDNHYGDTTDLERQRLYYTAHRRLAGFTELSASTPVYAIWDDHDFGPNNSDSTAVGKEASLQAFHEFWANPPRAANPDDPAIYFSFERQGVAFFMLDVRWHRSPNGQKDDANKTMLGAAQLAWLKAELKASKSAVKLIASGSEWQTHGHSDSWATFQTERNTLLSWMNEEGITGVIFLSGDRHFSAGYQIQERWVEFTAGPFGSENERNPKAAVSAETFTVQFSGKMWMILEIDTATSEPKLSYEIWQAGDGLLEQRELSWAAVNGKEKLVASELVQKIRAGLKEQVKGG